MSKQAKEKVDIKRTLVFPNGEKLAFKCKVGRSIAVIHTSKAGQQLMMLEPEAWEALCKG